MSQREGGKNLAFAGLQRERFPNRDRGIGGVGPVNSLGS